mmetsp:Transcript_28249/g.43112  ORF Transcript_28249/g.43112 Transcript_28249/m.43112 type:complete len:340 (+) Transcript_28249:349-1368(+)
METTPEQTAQGAALVRVLSAVLDRLVCANAPLALADPGQVTKFHALKAPGIGIHQYLERIHKYASCSNECFILALIYIDRLIQRNNFLLTELNVHRVVITAILLGAKFFDDAYYNNAYYAKVGGVLVCEMNGLEVDFLFRINFSLHVTPEVFRKYREELLSHSSSNEDSHEDSMSSIAQPLPPAPMVQMQVPPPNCQAEILKPNHLVEKRHNTYITPSPPPTSAQNASVPNNTDMNVDMNVDSTAEPYLQRANSMPVWQPSRCSPSSHTVYSNNVATEPYYVGESGVTYPIHHGTLVHHNHAKVEHGFHQGHTDSYDTGHHQYFMGGAAQMLTRCPGGS